MCLAYIMCPRDTKSPKDTGSGTVGRTSERGFAHEHHDYFSFGSGKRLFKEGAAGTDLQLTDCRKAGPDVLLLIYRPARTQAPAR
jgi:hypothetical protein